MIVAVSDVHLGSIFAQKELFYSFLRNLPAETELFLLGDIVDTWKGLPDPEFYDVTSRFKSIRYFPGNHDKEMEIARVLSPSVGAQHIIPVGFQRILFLHGDIFDASAGVDSVWNRGWDAFFYVVSKLLGFDIRARLKPVTVFVYQHMSDFYRKAVTYTNSQGCRYLVYGHTHVGTTLKKAGITLINLGSWYDTPRAFFLEGDSYACIEIKPDQLLPEEKDFNRIW